MANASDEDADPTAVLDADLAALPASVDRAPLRRMRAVARLLDESVRIPGTDYRIGLDPILGLLPVGGDVAAGCLSMYIVAEAARQGVSWWTLTLMVLNVALDVVGGFLPYVGDAFDAVWKANKRNYALALEDLAQQGERVEELEEGVDIDIE